MLAYHFLVFKLYKWIQIKPLGLSVIRRDGLSSNQEDSLAIPPTSLSNHGKISKKALELQVSRIKSNESNQTKFKFISEFSLESNLLKKLSARKADLIQSLFSIVGK